MIALTDPKSQSYENEICIFFIAIKRSLPSRKNYTTWTYDRAHVPLLPFPVPVATDGLTGSNQGSLSKEERSQHKQKQAKGSKREVISRQEGIDKSWGERDDGREAGAEPPWRGRQEAGRVARLRRPAGAGAGRLSPHSAAPRVRLRRSLGQQLLPFLPSLRIQARGPPPRRRQRNASK
jgi:hypothetical protein